jgi:serine/threonine protein kinase/formylglycine-generating enzyme required for sulfatase activity
VSFNAGDTVGDYEVIDVLGAGGMGQVFEVRNVISGRVEAMKILLPDLNNNPEAAQRFIREIQVVAALDHPNIAALRTAQRVGNQLVMIMEFVPGTTLMRKCKSAPIAVEEGLTYVTQALSALAYAHRKGVVHRDIKPANMMITPEGQVKLMDFGIAKSLCDRSLTRTGTTLGSVHYMSPEQVDPKTGVVDGRSDLYSLGVVLYEITTGRRPFDADSDYAIMAAQVQTPPVPPINLDPRLSVALNNIVLRALAKDPGQRYQTAEDFLDAIEQCCPPAARHKYAKTPWLTNGIVSEVPSTLVAQKNPRNQRWLARAGLVVAIVMATIVLSVFLYRFLHRTHQAVLALPSGDMVLVEAGQALLGRYRQAVRVESFYIDKTEVTNRAYLAFCRETGYPEPPGAQQAPPENPVVNVTFDDARAFAHWAKKRLPTAIEWEKAARGAKGHTYPWGDSLRYELANIPTDANSEHAALAPAASYPSGASPYGALNMLGNAWEWVDARTSAPDGAEFDTYETIFKDLTPGLSRTEPFYQIRGGSYRYEVAADQMPALLWDSSPAPARARKSDIGFRCARNP